MKTGRPPGKTIKAPISDLDRVKGVHVRDKTGLEKPIRELKTMRQYKERNTRGNKKK